MRNAARRCPMCSRSTIAPRTPIGLLTARPVRLESVQNANDQATVVAKVIGGGDASYDAAPWFWSSQYDLKLQTVGRSTGHDAVVLRGDPRSRSFSAI